MYVTKILLVNKKYAWQGDGFAIIYLNQDEL